MMKRFSRRRRGGGVRGAAPAAAAPIFERIAAETLLAGSDLSLLDVPEVVPPFAVMGSGTAAGGDRLLVSFAQRSGGDALLAGLAVGARLAEEDAFAGEVLVLAPEWSPEARQLLGLVGDLAFRVRAVAVPQLGDDPSAVVAGARAPAAALTSDQIAGHLARPADRDLFLRTARGLEGLAAKHGGVLRGSGRSLEMILLARRVAELRADAQGVVFDALAAQRASATLRSDDLSASLDALEGQIRRRLNDRRAREGEDGLRARAIPLFRTWYSLRALVPWPLASGESEVLDFVGVDVEGIPVVGAARERLGLDGLGSILEEAMRLQAALPSVLVRAAPPVQLDAVRLVLGAREVGAGVQRALAALTMPHELFQIRSGRDQSLELTGLGSGEARARAPEATSDAAPESEEGSDSASDSRDGRSRSRRRGRRGRGRRDSPRRGGESRPAEAEAADAQAEARDAPSEPRFDEISVFDLDDEPAGGDDGGRARRRGRGRRRGRRPADGAGGRDPSGGSGDEGNADEAADAKPDESGNGRRGRSQQRNQRRGRRSPDASAPAASSDEEATLPDDADDVDDDLDPDEADFSEDVPEFEPEPEPTYEDDEEIADEAEDGSGQPRRRSRSSEAAAAPVEAETPVFPRKRGAILAAADRDSIVGAVLIARDIRLVEGIWVYPQDELMNCFRGVTTDLREDTPIYVVGFRPSPARGVIQAAALYRGRLSWFDHHDWPPEDRQALADAIGEDAIRCTPGTGSVLPVIHSLTTRRSRFTDKLIDLLVGRFTQHDYERWGRLWWWRLGEIASRTGERRSDVDGLLSGRPSDLAREASHEETPPVPPEVEYVSRRDFRLVHFAGYVLVVVDVPSELDLHLCARIARERYSASLSLATRPDGELVVFAGDEHSGRRALDFGGLVEHVSHKLEWVEALPDDDHVARFRARGLQSHPERLDEIIAEIAMGRSVLER